MDILKIMGLPEGYCTRHTDMPNHLQTKAKTLSTRPLLRKQKRELKSYSSFSAPAIP